MSKVAIDHVEIRYRYADSASAWTTISVKPGAGPVSLPGVQSASSYQIEARNVGVNGAASEWTQQTQTSQSSTDAPYMPTYLTAEVSSAGINVSWTAPVGQSSDTQYTVERSGDNNGASDGNWKTLVTLASTSYVDISTTHLTYWYRVKAANYQGQESTYTDPVQVAPYPAPPVVTINESSTNTSGSGSTAMATDSITITSSGATITEKIWLTISWTWPSSYPTPSAFEIATFTGSDPTKSANYVFPLARVDASQTSYTASIAPTSSITITAAVRAIYA